MANYQNQPLRTMTIRHVVPVFFYGLFMDVDVLRQKALNPTNVRQASVPGFSIRIGHRATLVPDMKGRVHGILMDLSHEEIDRLYQEPSVRMYRPEPVLCEVGRGNVAALCFVLPEPPSPDEHDEGYARRLRELAERLALPGGYVDGIR
jgi:hypothetical protein